MGKDPYRDLAVAIKDSVTRERKRHAVIYRRFTVKTTVPLTLTSEDGLLVISEDDDDVEVLSGIRRRPLATGDVVEVRETADVFVLTDVVE